MLNELVRWDPFSTLPDLARWDPFEDSFFGAVPTFFRPVRRVAAFAPRIDVIDADGAYKVAVDVPGIKKEAIQVTVHENTLTISADLPEQEAGKDEAWLLRERGYGKFSRSIALPEAVDEETSEAKYLDGVLYLALRKKSAARSKRIAIH